MKSLLKTRVTLFWVLLMCITYASWELARGHVAAAGKRAAVAVIVAAMLKVRIVAFEFMEIRRAPFGVRRAVDAWAVTLCVALGVMYCCS
jgi:Prokaryotic Cytochrome C oxidase subunit IV